MTDEITRRYLLLLSNPLDSAAKNLGVGHFCGQDGVFLYSFDDTILPYKIASQTTRTKVDDGDIVNIEWQQVVDSPRSATANTKPETLFSAERILVEVTLYMISSDLAVGGKGGRDVSPFIILTLHNCKSKGRWFFWELPAPLSFTYKRVSSLLDPSASIASRLSHGTKFPSLPAYQGGGD